MKERELYTTISLELHLYFLRIIKEHAIFFAAGFAPSNLSFSREAKQFQLLFENLLLQAVHLGDGIVRSDVLASGELLTANTLTAELQTQAITNIPIRCDITELEIELTPSSLSEISLEQSQQLKYLNQQVLILLNKFIRFHEKVLEHISSDNTSSDYPLLIRHALTETKHYQTILTELESLPAHEIASAKSSKQFFSDISLLTLPLFSDHISREEKHYSRISL